MIWYGLSEPWSKDESITCSCTLSHYIVHLFKSRHISLPYEEFTFKILKWMKLAHSVIYLKSVERLRPLKVGEVGVGGGGHGDKEPKEGGSRRKAQHEHKQLQSKQYQITNNSMYM